MDHLGAEEVSNGYSGTQWVQGDLGLTPASVFLRLHLTGSLYFPSMIRVLGQIQVQLCQDTHCAILETQMLNHYQYIGILQAQTRIISLSFHFIQLKYFILRECYC